MSRGARSVRSILEYGSVIWAGAACSHLVRLERIQHKFLAFLAGTRRDRFDMTDYDGLCLSYRTEKLGKRRTALDLSFLHGVLRGKIESSLLLSQFSLHVAARRTRNSEFLFVPSCVGSWHQCLHLLLVCRVHLTLFYSLIHLLTYFMIPKRPCSVFIALSLKCIIYCAFIICLVCLCVWMRTTITGLYLCVAIQINEIKWNEGLAPANGCCWGPALAAVSFGMSRLHIYSFSRGPGPLR